MAYRRILTWLLVCVVVAPAVAGSGELPPTIYIDCAQGDDGNSGRLPEQAWRTLWRLEEHQGRDALPPDTRVLLRRGCTWHEPLVLISSGEPEHPIVVAPYGSGRPPVIDGAVPTAGAWDEVEANIWRTEINPDEPPLHVTVAGMPAARRESPGQVDETLEWGIDSANQYLYVSLRNLGDDPSEELPKVRVWTARRLIYLADPLGPHDITLQDLIVRHCARRCIEIAPGGERLTFRGVVAAAHSWGTARDVTYGLLVRSPKGDMTVDRSAFFLSGVGIGLVHPSRDALLLRGSAIFANWEVGIKGITQAPDPAVVASGTLIEGNGIGGKWSPDGHIVLMDLEPGAKIKTEEPPSPWVRRLLLKIAPYVPRATLTIDDVTTHHPERIPFWDELAELSRENGIPLTFAVVTSPDVLPDDAAPLLEKWFREGIYLENHGYVHDHLCPIDVDRDGEDDGQELFDLKYVGPGLEATLRVRSELDDHGDDRARWFSVEVDGAEDILLDLWDEHVDTVRKLVSYLDGQPEFEATTWIDDDGDGTNDRHAWPNNSSTILADVESVSIKETYRVKADVTRHRRSIVLDGKRRLEGMVEGLHINTYTPPFNDSCPALDELLWNSGIRGSRGPRGRRGAEGWSWGYENGVDPFRFPLARRMVGDPIDVFRQRVEETALLAAYTGEAMAWFSHQYDWDEDDDGVAEPGQAEEFIRHAEVIRRNFRLQYPYQLAADIDRDGFVFSRHDEVGNRIFQVYMSPIAQDTEFRVWGLTRRWVRLARTLRVLREMRRHRRHMRWLPRR